MVTSRCLLAGRSFFFVLWLLSALSAPGAAAAYQAAGVDAAREIVFRRNVHDVPRDEQWYWVWIDGTRCGLSEQPTGLVVNKAKASVPDGVVIFVSGGGACWSEASCTVGMASYLQGFGPQEWHRDVILSARQKSEPDHLGYFSRDTDNNPYARYDFVFIPYCTGDMHAGQRTVRYSDHMTMHYHGALNFSHFLAAIVEGYLYQPEAQPSQVLLAGGSAGAYGALWNYHRVQEAFGDIPVHLLCDSGLPLHEDVFTNRLHHLFHEAWGLGRVAMAPGQFPQPCRPVSLLEGCSPADTRFDHVFFQQYLPHYHNTRRFALVESVADPIMRMFLAFGFNLRGPEVVWSSQGPQITEDLFFQGLAHLGASINQWNRDAAGAVTPHYCYVDGQVPDPRDPAYADCDFSGRNPEYDCEVDYSTAHVLWKTRPGTEYLRVTDHEGFELNQWHASFIIGGSDWDDVVSHAMQAEITAYQE